jgi:hypothetical protein
MVSHVLSDFGSFLLHNILRELLHGHRDSVEKVARPGDSTSHRRQVTYNWWLLLILLVVVLNLLDLMTVLGE